ncbi:hypothetical protein CCR83_00725 [Rhodobacter veldkampii DSM 11550]|uniref:DUF192 domain-containing protein n=1 Tax=Phaeovulum veldkampii DSM 11550 TaxID=1185920 RepID=A0A2T4JKE0_9RHOB|nr:DUF192 domain-containing protein [Phaeovulum veldkampii]MBK5945005.1 hypothetical protein [Phaeovulum veldkampii DSM 11550]NCU21476.1 DUF192 domain-containing protein [Candidatus Falkowbacteria bacterium]PTE18352.1 hypothetical protein C5F46_05290 [Phaeovulum veldkampii DSM 11550]TDQ57836.1 hypothetical protein EV658_111103 [Phaeovulum veldkampii DSM 11550]
MRAAVFALLVAATGAGAGECQDDLALIRAGERQVRLAVEVADDPAERAQGLMGRESLPKGAGMLFIYDRAQPVAFWMKNTPLPLDMIFFDAAGRVVRVHENARPFDETPILGGDAVLMVLEINGGMARRLGIGPGAELAHPQLSQDGAAFPCN